MNSSGWGILFARELIYFAGATASQPMTNDLRWLRRILIVCAVVATSTSSYADHHARNPGLNGKIVILRHFYSENNQRFDTTGQPMFTSAQCTWTMCGLVRVFATDARQDKVVIKAERQNVYFTETGYHFAPAHTNVTLTIFASPNGDREALLQDAMHAVILGSNEDIASLLPSYWQLYLDCIARNQNPVEFVKTDEFRSRSKLISGKDKGVQPPEALHTPDPVYPDLAFREGLQARVILHAVIGADGIPRDIEILEPAGFGFDEAAVEAVTKWRFKPAEKDGKPIDFAMNTQINFLGYRPNGMPHFSRH